MLTGMMGAGKTSVGRLLAQRLEWEFIDTDERVERAASASIAEIFSRQGEEAFRALEREVLAALPTRNAVIALGGGAAVASESRALLRELGTLVWLDASPDTLAARVGGGDERPVLADLGPGGRVERLAGLRAEREASYARADLRIETDGRTPDEVCAAVLTALGWEDAA